MVERPDELQPDDERPGEGEAPESDEDMRREAGADDSLAPGSMPPSEDSQDG